jgi:hypothetical protein
VIPTLKRTGIKRRGMRGEEDSERVEAEAGASALIEQLTEESKLQGCDSAPRS